MIMNTGTNLNAISPSGELPVEYKGRNFDDRLPMATGGKHHRQKRQVGGSSTTARAPGRCVGKTTSWRSTRRTHTRSPAAKSALSWSQRTWQMTMNTAAVASTTGARSPPKAASPGGG